MSCILKDISFSKLFVGRLVASPLHQDWLLQIGRGCLMVTDWLLSFSDWLLCYGYVTTEAELASLQAHLDEIFCTFLWHFKRDLFPDQKGRETKASAKAWRVIQTTHQPAQWALTQLCQGGECVLPESPPSHHRKHKANELNLSNSGGLM